MQHATHSSHYRSFAIELLVEGIIMFFVMYAMVDTADSIYLNTNNLYMTLMMVALMALVMLVAMRHIMFYNHKLNVALFVFFALLFAVSFYAMRTQAGVGDAQFLRAMIPHHSGAVLMCEKASITNPEIKNLCQQIIESQQREIIQMQSILKKY